MDEISEPAPAADPGADAGSWPFLAEQDGGWVRYMRRRRVRATVGVLAAVVVLGAAGTAAAGWGLGARQPQQPASSTLPPATAKVTRATLTQTEQISGTLGYGASGTVVARTAVASANGPGTGAASGAGSAAGSGTGTGSGTRTGSGGSSTASQNTAPATTNTLTWLPPVGSVVRPGQPAYRVDNRPVLLLAGGIPLYRVLTTGLDGPDVAMLERNLRAFGYYGFRVDSTFTGSTASAVKAWQRHLGWPATGAVNVNQVVVAPGPLRVTGHRAALGADATGEVLGYTGTTRVVTVALEVSRQQLVRVGLTATVTLPDGRTVAGRVASVGTVASGANGDGSAGDGSAGAGGPADPGGQQSGQSGPTVQVLVTIANQAALGRLDAAPVALSLVAAQRRNVLTVPVGALVALAEGGYGVQVVEGSTTRYVAVRTGMFADGLVEVSGPGIRAGMTVGVPA